ncbi:MAG: TetR/AcrR family transcriptional regulator [Planctomycetes bacterium]|nr:TetR/AcrR family transcriptional regulator [Planctomycetota bacterium]
MKRTAALPPSRSAARQEREFRERDRRILEVARELLLAKGYHGVSMDAIAEAIEYSKGTVYLHYRSKEDVLMALARETAERRAEMFERAAQFRGGTRERMVAVGEACALFVDLYPSHFRTEQILRMSSVRQRSAPDRQEALQGCENRCMGTVSGIVRDAVAQGDLELRPPANPVVLSFGLWSMTFGSYFLMSAELPLRHLGLADARGALRRNCHALMDGYGWRPLFSGWDYEKTYARIHSEVFPEEISRAPRR